MRKRSAADNGGVRTLAAAYESDVSEGVEMNWLCYFTRNYL